MSGSVLDTVGLIGLWGSLAEFCRATGVPEATVRGWITREKIPPEQWDGMIASAASLGIRGVNLDTLMAAVRIGIARKRRDRDRALAEAARRGRKSTQRLSVMR
jgi:hypothetical protein